MEREIKFRIYNGSNMEYNVTTGKFGTFYVNPTNNGLDRLMEITNRAKE